MCFGHIDISQREAVLSNHCFAEWLGSQICNVFFTLDSAYSQPLGSDFILHPQVGHIVVSQFPNSLLVEDVFSGFRIIGQHWLHIVSQTSQQRHDPFDSDAPNAAAYSSASALLHVMMFCFRVYAFNA